MISSDTMDSMAVFCALRPQVLDLPSGAAAAPGEAAAAAACCSVRELGLGGAGDTAGRLLGGIVQRGIERSCCCVSVGSECFLGEEPWRARLLRRHICA